MQLERIEISWTYNSGVTIIIVYISLGINSMYLQGRSSQTDSFWGHRLRFNHTPGHMNIIKLCPNAV